MSDLYFFQDSSYDLRLMSRSSKVLSEPSESVNVSTIGKSLCTRHHEHYMQFESKFHSIFILQDIYKTSFLFIYANSIIYCVLIAGMEIYPLRSSFLEVIPEPLLAGVLGGVCFLFVAIILSLVTACYMSHRRQLRRRKTRQGKTLD